MDIQTILSQIDIGSFALPEFQRGYVWNRDQVRKLMYSLYRGYPIGGLLTWVTQTNNKITRGDHELSPGTVSLILDGQQRITSLYGIIRGREPAFFEGNKSAFTGLYFNLEDEIFEFYAPVKMKDNPYWINVTELMQVGAGAYIGKRIENGDNTFLLQYMEKLNKIDNIKKTDLHIEQVAGTDKTIDVVVEIFNNVNSGGTKLSKGDLALAKICAEWPDARKEFRAIMKKFSDAKYDFEIDWFLRCLTVYLTGQPYFSVLGSIEIDKIKQAVPKIEGLIGNILDQIGSRLGLDHNRVLGSRYSIPVMIEVVKRAGGKLGSSAEWNKLLYWYIHTFLWGRYAGSTESVLSQDLRILANGEGVDGLIRQLRLIRGELGLKADDFWGWSTGARFYPLLYLLTRVNHARDLGSGIELSNSLLGSNSSLEIHHVFPKSLLYKAGYSKPLVNSLANYTFLTKDTNLAISNKAPKDYIPEYMIKTPGAIESHWIPTDSRLYEIDNYEEFLERRRELLADMANNFLDSLLHDKLQAAQISSYSTRGIVDHVDLADEEEQLIIELLQWLEERGLPLGENSFELTNENGDLLTIMDLAWPNGLQQGLSEPIALMMDETAEDYKIANDFGFKYFTDIESIKDYISAYFEI